MIAANLLEFEGDYFRVDQVAAICVNEASEPISEEDDHEESEIQVHLMGKPEPIRFWYETRAEADSEQAKLVKKWIDLLK